jgi:glycosyltransferase involved in cell wall biosynthesis
VEERRAGLAFARNAGLEILTGDFAAFIDDDVIVGEHWLDAVHGSLSSDSEVVAVSGPILPLELETRGQVLLEQFGAFSKGFTRRRYILGMTDPPPLFPYAPARVRASRINVALFTVSGRTPRI